MGYINHLSCASGCDTPVYHGDVTGVEIETEPWQKGRGSALQNLVHFCCRSCGVNNVAFVSEEVAEHLGMSKVRFLPTIGFFPREINDPERQSTLELDAWGRTFILMLDIAGNNPISHLAFREMQDKTGIPDRIQP